MERNKIAQVYGYAVCLVAVITFLISASQIANAAFNLSDPLRAEGFGRSGSLTSFAAYKRDQTERAPARLATPGDSANAKPSATELRQMFEDERLDQIGNVRFRSTKTLVTSILMIIIASGLFLMHWRWLRRDDLKS